MRNKRILVMLGCIGIGVLQFLMAEVSAEIYQWKDAEGHTIFSETPPPGVKSTIVKPKSGKASAEAIEKLKASTAPPKPQGDAKSADKKQDKAKTPPEPTAAERKANCEKAQGILAHLQNASRRMQKEDEKHELRFLTEDERQQQIKASQESIKYWCAK